MYAGGANFTSLFFMNVYRIYLSCLICFHPFVDDLTKRGRSICVVSYFDFMFYTFSYFVHVYSYMFFICSCFSIVYLFSIALLEGEFLPPFYILCYSLYVLSSSKRGRLLAQWLHSPVYAF